MDALFKLGNHFYAALFVHMYKYILPTLNEQPWCNQTCK